MSNKNNVTGNGYQYHLNNASQAGLKKRQAEHQKMKQNDKVVIKLTSNGVSQNFMRNLLRQDIELGIAIDNNDDGMVDTFSKQNKENLSKEITKIFSEHGYSTNFTSMKKYNSQTSTNGNGMFEISYKEYLQLAKAAGYDINIDENSSVEEPQPQEQEKIEEKPTQPEVNADSAVETSNVKTAQKVLDEEIENNPLLKGKTPEEQAEIVNNEIRKCQMEISSLNQPVTTKKRTGFLGLGKKKTVTVEDTPEEKSKKEAQINELKQKIDSLNKTKVYLATKTNKYWYSHISQSKYKDESGNTTTYPDYTQVVYKDSKGNTFRATRVGTYNPQKLAYDYKYYPIDVQKLNSGFTEAETTYWGVVPDLDHELTGGEEVESH